MVESSKSGIMHCSNLIGLIYDAAEDPALWPELLAELNGFLDEAGDEVDQNRQLLDPHFRRAMDLNRRLSQLTSSNRTSEALLNPLPIGIILVNGDAKPQAMNARAKMLLNHSPELRISNHRLAAKSPTVTRRLQQAIHHCALGAGNGSGTPMLLGDGEHTISIWMSETPSPQPNDEGRSVAIYITSALIRPQINVDALQQTFSLTAAEARLVKLLANGHHSIKAVSETLGTSVHTARSQLKSVFHKTGTANQLELIKSVLTHPSVLVGEPQPVSAIGLLPGGPEQGRVIRLFDGRALSFCEYGDPDGHPVLMTHGIAASRLQFPPDVHVAQTLELRFILPDRPGYGFSDPRNDRTVLDYADDITQLANQLGISRFSLFAPGGWGYAMACAVSMPERITSFTIINGRGPIDSFAETLSIDGAMYRLARHAPGLLKRYVGIMHADVMRDPTAAMERRNRHLCEEDRTLIAARSEHMQIYAAAVQEAGRQGAIGVVEDMITLMRPWGFSPADIPIGVRLWHGKKNREVPLRSARKLARNLPRCDATYVDNIGFMLLITHWRELLQEIANAAQHDGES